ncbi:MAG TPA: hypothetical protein VFY79_00825 [Dehalococcoidia bacterium]|jgi:hypothetical protein|nr:hypothetical protein [Dehalococcoidia bacterium]
MRNRLLAFTTVVLTGAMLAAACSTGSNSPKATPTPQQPGAVDAIAGWVKQNRSIPFLGNCSSAKQGVDIGKLCITPAGQRGQTLAFTLGPTFSDPTATVMVQQQKDTTWKVLSVTNNDPNAGEVPGIAWPLEVGDRVVIVGLDDCLSVRDTPSQTGKRTACIPLGTTGIIQDGPTQAETYTWWKIAGTDKAGNDFNGWAVDKYMRLPDALIAVLHPGATPTAAH